MTVDVVNCNCTDENPNETLSALRTRIIRRLGFSAQAANPPPGMADLVDDFLISGQKYLYQKYPVLRTKRFFTWTMTPGTRFYDLDANDERAGTDPECDKQLNEFKIDWVGVEDTNGTWLPMRKGINPTRYTSGQFQGLPDSYEIRQCIEIFPPPDEAYKLRVRGTFKLEAFTDDDDQSTIDSEALFLWALANAKNHYGKSDAEATAGQATGYISSLVGDSHHTARYVPGAAEVPNATKPMFEDLENYS